MLTMRVRIEGMPQVQSALVATKRVLRDLTPEFKKTGAYLMELFANQSFESEGAIYGMKWPELNPRYRLWKAKQYPGKGILERTGRLRKGFKQATAPTYLLIWNDVEYGRKHQAGIDVPKRSIIALPQPQRDAVEATIHNSLLARVKGAVNA